MTKGRRGLALLGLACLLAAAPARAQEAPRRVVSINLCTDQLAMLVAGEGQLLSVSHLASDPYSSAMAGEARAFTVNHGLAEEVFLMRPDLILAGTYTARATVDLLVRLDFRVELFEPAGSFDDIRRHIERIGVLLGQEARAGALVDELDAGLAELAAAPASGKRAISYSSNSYVTGTGTLTDAVMEAAGLGNIAAERGIVGGARIPLEMLLAEQPDLIVTGTTAYEKPALAQQNFSHPAFTAYAEGKVVSVPDSHWICGAPFTLDAAWMLRQAAGAGK